MQYLMGENLKVVWAQFSTLSLVVLICRTISAWHDNQPLIRVENSSCHLKFVHEFTYKPVILSFIMLSVVMLSAVAPKAGPNSLALSRIKETSQYETGAEITTNYFLHNLPKGSIS